MEVCMNGEEAFVNGIKVIIPFGLKRPILLDFRDFEDWLRLERQFAIQLKCKLESGQVRVRNVKKEMLGWAKRTEEQFKRVAVLRIEDRMLALDVQVKKAMSRASPDLSKCLHLLQFFNNLEITRLMLLKNPHIILTMDLLTKYERKVRRGKTQCARKVEEIKKQASKNIRKFRDLFQVPFEKSFAEVFDMELSVFRKRTAKMKAGEKLLLVDERMVLSFIETASYRF